MADTFEGWTILELMGHRRLAGYLTEHEIAGASFLRLDIPDQDGEIVTTQFYAPSAVYCITPATEDTARAVARGSRPAPVQRWELPAPMPDPWKGEGYEDPEQYDPDDEDLDDVPGRSVDDVQTGERL